VGQIRPIGIFCERLSDSPVAGHLSGSRASWLRLVRAGFCGGVGKGSRLYNTKHKCSGEELLSARGTSALQTALFIGKIRGRLSFKEVGQLAS
jgi:hypothetical protein